MQGGAAVPHFASKMHLSSSVSLGHLVTEIHSGCLGCDRLCCEEMPGNKAVGIFCVCSYMVDTGAQGCLEGSLDLGASLTAWGVL